MREKETFFNTRDILYRNMGKFPIYEMPPTFDSMDVSRPSRNVGTLQKFLEIFLSLGKDPDALVEIVRLLN